MFEMKQRIIALFALGLFALSVANAHEELVLVQKAAEVVPSVKLPETISAAWPGGFITLIADTQQKDVQWLSVSPEFQLVPREILKDSKYALGLATRPGRYMVLAWVAEGGVPSRAAVCWVTVGSVDPLPPQPIPVPPIPVPPTPTPVPVPVPVPVTGLRVVLIYESGQGMTKAQQTAFYSPAVEQYLNAKCADGKKGWRRYDKDVDTSFETPTFKALWAATKPLVVRTPCIAVVTDQKGEVYNLPETEQALLDFLKMWGGN